jgi:gliding motility-associated-like protein
MKGFLHHSVHKTIVVVAILLCSGVLMNGTLKAQLAVNSSVNAANAVQNVLLGEGVTASNITFQGNQSTQIGSFICNNCGIGLASGVIMGSGHVNGAQGPNTSGSFSQGPPTGWDNASDPDLAMLAGNSIHNAAVLRFNFIPTGDSLKFRFVFGSDEYPEFVNSINDVFGFFISGPGISGPYQNGAKNIALIPGTTSPVSINSVNYNSNANSAYYVRNHSANNTGYSQIHNVQADGFTTVLTAQTPVICGATYQIKIAIGDASDGSYDSWVFLEANSFQSNAVQISYTAPPLSPSGTGLYEGCDVSEITFTRPEAASGIQATYPLSYSGTAINGLDCELLPDEITFPIGSTSISLPIVALADSYSEGTETLILTVQDLGCNAGNPVNITIHISDVPQMTVDIPDQTINCGDTVVMEPVITGGLGYYKVDWTTLGLTQPSITTYPTGPISYPFIITDTCGVNPVSGTANVYFVQNPPLVVDLGPDLTAQCIDQITISPVVTGGYGNHVYSWTSNGQYLSSAPSVSFMENTNQVISLTVTDDCLVSTTDQMTVTYPPEPVTVNIGPDITTNCITQNLVQSSVSGGVGSYSYNWTLGSAPLGYSSSVNVQIGSSATLTLQVVDECGNSNSDQLAVIIPPVNIVLDLGPDVTADCITTTYHAPVQLENGIGSYSYSWTNNGAFVSSASQYSLQTGETRTVSLTVTDQCGNTASDQKQVIIPSAPIALTVFPAGDTIICIGTWAKLGALASGGVGNLTYSWTGITGTPNNTQNSSIVSESPGQNSEYSVTVTDQCGNSNSGSTRVIVRELFPQFESKYVSETEVVFENTTGDNSPFIWNFGNGTTSYDNEVTVNFLGAQAWTGTLTIFSPEGCSESITEEFTAVGELFVPNCFTPDNDGVNDFFFVKGHDLRYFELTIFNRYGEVVFKTYDMNEPWDGSHQGREFYVPNGVYNFQLMAIGNRENIIERKGRITVFR